MSEWIGTKLGTLIDYKKGYAFKSAKYNSLGDILIVRISDTTENSINVSSCHKILKDSALGLEGYSLEYEDIIIATVGSWADNPNSIVGKVIKVPKEASGALLNQNAVRIRAKLKVQQNYLYYILKTKEFSNYLLANAQGSANQASITLQDIFSYFFLLPTINEQKAIASVLSSLDDKIDLLHRQNKTLEVMAKILFRQWFVEEAKESWESVILGNYVSCFNGVSYKSTELDSSKTALVTLKNFSIDGAFRLDGFKEFVGSYKEQQIVKTGDLIVAHTDLTQNAAIIGNPLLVVNPNSYNTLVISMDLVKVVSNHNWISNSFLYYLMGTREFKYHALGCTNGTTVLHLSKQAIPSYEFKLPPIEKITAFSSIADNTTFKIETNINKIKILEKLRDTLLPKLMSGEVRVDYEAKNS